MQDVKIQIRTRKESYAFVTLKPKAQVAYPEIEKAMKRTPFKFDDLSWGTVSPFKKKK